MAKPKIGLVSLGCPKATVDSEAFMTPLLQAGYDPATSHEEADIVVINTCGFIDAAIDESKEAIAHALAANGRVVVTGCLGAKAETDLRAEFPDLLAVTGPQETKAVVQAVQQFAPMPVGSSNEPAVIELGPTGARLTPPHYSYLKISEGCNHKCQFCIIPSMRGALRSRPMGELLARAQVLATSGVQELLVIAQDTSAYGSDLKYPKVDWRGDEYRGDLPTLCEQLGEIVPWVRLHYVYPYPSVDRLIPLMQQGSLLPYLDIPLQHGSEAVLRRMRRPASTGKTLDRLKRWRDICPELVLRSTFIVGFPGETEAEFEELLDFLEVAQLDHAGAFMYSAVAGAAANQLPNQVAEEDKQHRLEVLMDVQAAISARRKQRLVGQNIEVLIDDDQPDEGLGYQAVGRSQGDAPDVDGQVFIRASEPLSAGQRILVRVTDADDHDLFGENLGNAVKIH